MSKDSDFAEALVEYAWAKHRAVLVYGAVSKAVWLPPNPDSGDPGVLAAPGPEEARVFLEHLFGGELDLTPLPREKGRTPGVHPTR